MSDPISAISQISALGSAKMSGMGADYRQLSPMMMSQAGGMNPEMVLQQFAKLLSQNQKASGLSETNSLSGMGTQISMDGQVAKAASMDDFFNPAAAIKRSTEQINAYRNSTAFKKSIESMENTARTVGVDVSEFKRMLENPMDPSVNTLLAMHQSVELDAVLSQASAMAGAVKGFLGKLLHSSG